MNGRTEQIKETLIYDLSEKTVRCINSDEITTNEIERSIKI